MSVAVLLLTSNNLSLYRPLTVLAKVLASPAYSPGDRVLPHTRVLPTQPACTVMAADVVISFIHRGSCGQDSATRGGESVPLLVETCCPWKIRVELSLLSDIQPLSLFQTIIS